MTERPVVAHGLIGLLSALVGSILPAQAQQPVAPPPCGGVFNIAAQIVRVDPAGASLTRLLRTGERKPVGLHDVICRGETLLFAGGEAQRAVLREADQRKVLVPAQSYVAPSGVVDAAERAFSYMAGILRTVEALPPAADIPGPNAVRGSLSPGQPSVALPIRSLTLLEDLPRQRLVRDLPVTLSWRGGSAPYQCEAVSRLGVVIRKGEAMADGSWCALDAGQAEATQVAVRDAQGRLVTWNLELVSWSEVPRPDWLPPARATPSAAESTAWAWWLWKSGGSPWRLQALAMMHAQAGTVWMAGYLRDQVLTETPQFAPDPSR